MKSFTNLKYVVINLKYLIMKKVNFIFIGLILVLLSVGVNAQAQNSGDYFVGDWEVTIIGLPDGDAVMTMHLEKADGKFKGNFKSEMGELDIDSVDEKENSITVYLSLGGYDLNMLLEKVDDNNIKGDMAEGMFDIVGKRIVK